MKRGKSTGKRKGGMKKKKSKKKEYLPHVHDIPEYIHPDLITPKVVIGVSLVGPINELLEQTFEMLITERTSKLIDKIKAIHKGSIQGITVCLEKYSADEILDPELTLEENGIDGEEEIKILYDYKVIDYPLLK